MSSRFYCERYVSFTAPSRAAGCAAPDKRSRFATLFLVAISAALASCGGLVSAPPSVAVVVSPASAQSYPDGTIQFSATAQNSSSSAVNWQVNTVTGGSPGSGTISATGLYTAPPQTPTTATVTVTAVLQADSTKTGSATVTIQSLSSIPSLVLAPALASITPWQTLSLRVVTQNLSNSLVAWSVDGILNGSATAGTISNGVYVAPGVAGPHVITASLIGSSASGSSTVQVTDFAGAVTWRGDNSRSGVNSQERVLSASHVSISTFGKLFSCPVNGNLYAQPLYVSNLAFPGSGTHNVVFVATEMDTDANPCVPLWATPTTLIPAGEVAISTPNFAITGSDITPFVGITGTPVIDPVSSTLYVVAKTQSTAVNPVSHLRLYALDLITGQPKIQTAGVEISSPSGVTPPFIPTLENQRAALLLDNDIVYVAFGSYDLQPDYRGWMFGYNAATLNAVLSFDVTPDLTGGGIWQGGGGPAADANHSVYVTTGNGPMDAYRGGGSYGESLVRLATGTGLSVAGYFSPCNEAAMLSAGQDLGSTAPLLLPTSNNRPNLVVAGAKNGSLYVLNRDQLGGFSISCPDASAQTVPVGDGGIFGTPAYWNNSIYVSGGNGALKQLPVAAGVLGAVATSQSPEALGPLGATPAISVNGSDAASGLAWVIDTRGAPNGPAILRVFDANNLSNELYNSAMLPTVDAAGLAVKFSVPTVANGKVYVGTQSELDVYGLLH